MYQRNEKRLEVETLRSSEQGLRRLMELCLQNENNRSSRITIPLSVDEIMKPFLCAIDTEFVALSLGSLGLSTDGRRIENRPNRLGLARVSVVRGDGEKVSVPFIDDYIQMTEPVVDYLTEFSGITSQIISFIPQLTLILRG